MKTSIVNGQKYLTTVRRGVEYTLMRSGDGWGVASRRLALGRFNVGGYRSYATLADVKVNCKAFTDVDITQIL